MICKNCGFEAERGWKFCPNCGSRLSKGAFPSIDSIFADIERELQETMNDMLEKNFEAFDISPYFEGGQGKRGFSIKIVNKDGDPKPEISIKTFGDVDAEGLKKYMEKIINSMLRASGQRVEIKKEQPPIKEKRPRQKMVIPPKVTEEPVANIRQMGQSVVVELDMPDVKSANDIEVRELESSVEVKARAGEKMYFKILTKPENRRLANYEFSGRTLFLEFR